MELFKLLGTIAIDNKDANKALDDTSQKGEKTESKLSKAFSAVGKGAAVAGKAIATGLAAGATAMATLTVKALNMSGELEQNMGGSEAVFAEFADSVQAKAKEAFSQMGLSTSDYLATANKMGALFQGAGFSIEESMNLSSSAMQRAADVASIMGIDTTAAMEAVAGAAKGNFTMMDNLGVAMNATTIEAYAMSKGFNVAYKDMTNQEKIGLAMEMFLERTAYATGNYAKENETLAGSLSTAKSAMTNFLDGSGTVDDLVSSFSNAANVIIENLKTIAPRLISGISDIINKVAPMLPPLMQELLPVIIDGAVSLINGVVDALPMIISVIMEALPALIDGLIQVVVALVAAMPQIIQQFIDYVPEIVTSVVTTLINNLPMLVDGVWQLIVGLIAAVPQFLAAILEGLAPIFSGVIDKVVEFGTPFVEKFKEIWDKVVETLTTLWENIKNIVETGIMLIGSILSAAFDIIAVPFMFVWENCKEYVYAAFEWIKEKIDLAVEAVKAIIEPGFNFVKEKIIAPITEAKTKAAEIFTAIKKSISDKISEAKTKVTNTFNSIKTSISSITSSIKSATSSTWNDIKSKMTKPIEDAKSKIKTLVDGIKSFFTSMKLDLPKIKLPHFKVTGKLSIDPPSVPSLSIEWYKKAMGNPIVMNEPTIFGYNPATGSFMGGGEAGSEVVSGTNTLMNMIQNAVASENGAIVYYLQTLIEILADYFPQVLEALDACFDADYFIKRKAPEIDKQLGILHSGKVRGR